MARFLIATIPVTGHVSPLLSVAKALVNCSHEVYWYSSQRYQKRIEQTGATFLPFRTAKDINYDNINELYPERAQLKGLAQAKWDMMRLIIDASLDQYDDLFALVEQIAPDVMIGDIFSLGAQCVAEAKHLPYAVVNITNLGFPSQDTAPDGFGLAPSTTALGRWRNRFLNTMLSRVVFRDVAAYMMQKRNDIGLSPIRESLFEIPFRSQLFLQPTIPQFEYPRRDLPEHVHFIGALIPDAPTDFIKPDWWVELKSNRPVVLVTQGTVATDFDELLTPTLQGLADENLLVVGTTANQPIDNVKVEHLPKNVRLEQFIPFNHLMPHLDVMVTNGGYGGIHFALTHGVPIVAGGMSEDKAEICARVAWAGIGINLKTATPTPEQIREAVTSVLSTHRFQEKSKVLQAEFAQYDAPSKAVQLLEQLIYQTGA